MSAFEEWWRLDAVEFGSLSNETLIMEVLFDIRQMTARILRLLEENDEEEEEEDDG
ncbi:MAG: hypothetical protein ACYDCH_02925 [Gaiellaceae bacterium]